MNAAAPVALPAWAATVREKYLAGEASTVVRDGVVLDYLGAVELVRSLKARVEAQLGCALTAAHGAYPPGVPLSDVRAVQHVIEATGMDCTGLEIHQARRLKDLSGELEWERIMLQRRRKTLAVCSKCHAKIDPDRRIRLN